MDIDVVLNNPAFSRISPEQRVAYRELATKLKNKNLTESMPVIMEFMATAPKGNKLSEAEQSAMIEAVSANLSESERTRFKALLTFVKR